MTILLRNLLARTPKLSDAEAIATLLTICDALEGGLSRYTEEEILTPWQQPNFTLATDAWLIVTNQGQRVGYACLSHDQHTCIRLQACVHPHYRGRGIGTLLLRLAEVRARQRISFAPPEARVTLTNAVSGTNHAAKELLEYEGYTFLNHFWRIVIETNEVSQTHKLVFDVNCSCVTGTIRTYEPSGLYTVRQYALYEKELRVGNEMDTCETPNTQLMIA